MEERGIGVAILIVVVVVVVAVASIGGYYLVKRGETQQTSKDNGTEIKPAPSPNLSVVVANLYYNYTIDAFGIELLNQGNASATITKVFLEQTGYGGGYQLSYAPITVEPQSTAWVYVQLDFKADRDYFSTGSIVCKLLDSSGNVLYSNNSLTYNVKSNLGD